MSRVDLDNADPTYVDTPHGIFTDAGIWFHVTEQQLRDYAEPVLEQVGIDKLLDWAGVWIRSPQVLTVWLLPILLWMFHPVVAGLGALGFYVGWKVLSPSVISTIALRVFNWLDVVVVQGLFYVLMMSIFAAQEQFAALAVGLIGFVVLRWGLLERAVKPLLRPLLQSIYPLPYPDQVLRALITRVAVNHRLSLPQIDDMQQKMIRTWTMKNNS